MQNPIKTAGLNWRKNDRRGKRMKRTNSSWSRDIKSGRIASQSSSWLHWKMVEINRYSIEIQSAYLQKLRTASRCSRVSATANWKFTVQRLRRIISSFARCWAPAPSRFARPQGGEGSYRSWESLKLRRGPYFIFIFRGGIHSHITVFFLRKFIIDKSID